MEVLMFMYVPLTFNVKFDMMEYGRQYQNYNPNLDPNPNYYSDNNKYLSFMYCVRQ